MATHARKNDFRQEETVSQHTQINMPAPMPETGPVLTFFTGGSAMKQTSRALKQWTHRSQHIVSPFDSGGSSAQLRKAFNMPAIGDLRSRLLALTDETYDGQSAAYQLLNYRLPKKAQQASLQQELDAMIMAAHPLVRALPAHWQTPICHDLHVFNTRKPSDFDLQGASIGNLVLAGSYLEHKGSIGEVLTHVKSMVHLLGDVELASYEVMDLVARLDDGTQVVGQHRITGKEHAPLTKKITEVYLSKNGYRAKCKASQEALNAIKKSDLICYAPGSFYSSLIATLLPTGIKEEIAKNSCSKVFIPSLGTDPEIPNLSPYSRVKNLLTYLSSNNMREQNVLNTVLYDPNYTKFSREDENNLMSCGVYLKKSVLVNPKKITSYCPQKLSEAILKESSNKYSAEGIFELKV
jgi:CofD-related protein of GAK system